MGGSQYKGETPRSHAEINTIIINLQERINAYDKLLTGNGVKMGEFDYASLWSLKDDFIKEIPWGGFGVFVDTWSLCDFFNM